MLTLQLNKFIFKQISQKENQQQAKETLILNKTIRVGANLVV